MRWVVVKVWFSVVERLGCDGKVRQEERRRDVKPV